MTARVERPSWERQPGEGERAYAAFLAYRDLGPMRTLEATRKSLLKRPGYLKPIERWSARCEWRWRAGAWDDHLQAEREQVAAEEAAKWERRRLQALEEGWQTCQALRARLAQRLALPLEPPPAAAPSGPAEGPPVAIPESVAAPEATSRRGSARENDLALARLAKLIVQLEWALITEALPPPAEIDPWTASDEEIKAYMARHPRMGRPPSR